MHSSEILEAHREPIRALAARHGVANVRVFGFVLDAVDTGDSDLDVLVAPTPRTTIMDGTALRIGVEALLGEAATV